MKNSENYLRSSIDDIVFEHRNKAYGAYQLRKSTDKHTITAVFAGAALTVVIAVWSLSHRAADVIQPYIETIINLADVKTPEIPKMEVTPPVAPPVAAPAVQTIQHVEMRPVDDAQATAVNVPTIDDLKNKVISNVTNTSTTNTQVPILKDPMPKSTTTAKKSDVVSFAEVMPSFGDGFAAMQQWLANHIVYPKMALDSDIDGTVYVSFVINTDGSISEASVARGIGFGCDEEAVRAVESMPKWKPGMQNGQPVRVRTTVPIKFEVMH